MKKCKRLAALGLTAAMCISLLAGCGGDSSSNSEGGTAASGEGIGDTITIGVNSDWNDISPFGTLSNTRSAVKGNFYESLAARKDFGAELEDMVLVCAKEITQVDDLTYDVEMYDYIKDSEGNEITAEDYAWSAMTMKEKGNYEKLNSYLDSVTATGDYTVEIKLSDNPLGTIEYMDLC